jgi:hypothetical protein
MAVSSAVQSFSFMFGPQLQQSKTKSNKPGHSKSGAPKMSDGVRVNP